MKVYQGSKNQVNKDNLCVIDPHALLSVASKGLLSLSVNLGMEVLHQIFEADVTELAGPKGKHQKDRKAYRHGTEKSRVVLGGEKVPIKKPRVRSVAGEEMTLESLDFFQQEDPLNEAVITRLLSGVSTRKYARTLDVRVEDASCLSKSEVSRRFSAGLQAQMETFFSRPLEDDYPVIFMDGLTLGKMTVVAAMGIRVDGQKRMLGLIEGGSENSEMVKELLADLLKRGLKKEEPRLYVLDGSKALYKAVKDTFGEKAIIQRCQVHKKRNVLSHLPESEKAKVSLAMSLAYREHDYDKAKVALEQLADRLESRYPSAASSLREGLEESLTVHRLKLPGLLRQTLSSTNTIESANAACAGVLRRVSHFRDGKMTLRHAAAGFLEAERGFRRIKGYKEIPFLLHNLDLLTTTGNWDILASA